MVDRSGHGAWTPEKDRPFSASCNIILHLNGSMGDSEPPDISSISLLGTLGPARGQETLYETCVLVSFRVACALFFRCCKTLHNRPFSVASEEIKSLRPDVFLVGTEAPRYRRLHKVKLVLVSFKLCSH